MLLADFQIKLKEYSLDSQALTLVGISGGADSLVLLDLFYRSELPVAAAHLNHGLRLEAPADARRVAWVAETLKIPFVSETIDVALYARQNRLSTEEAARVCRYNFLFKRAQSLGARAVAVGHHADDQAETVLMHFLRGSGLAGLKGMRPYLLPNPWSDEIPLLRPLLGVPRAEIVTYCTERGLNPIEDSSNLDTSLFRNRLRHETLPDLDELIPGVRQRLGQMADIFAADEDILANLTMQARRETLIEQGAGFLAFNARKLTGQPMGIQRRLIRWAAGQLIEDLRDVGFGAVARALAVLHGEAGMADLVMGLRVFSEAGHFYMAMENAELPSRLWPQLGQAAGVIDCTVPGELVLPKGWVLRCEILGDVEKARAQAIENSDPYRVWIALRGQQPAQVQIRGRRPGDRIQPLGMDGAAVKISDLMINAKVPRRARARWPIVLLENRIAWVPGLHVSQGFKITSASKRIIFMELLSLN
ncbi:MAG: tRNA lysidine(34) synthetase TilS [Chloroflexi bacterium]|nr:tRNA lysidine(34) synthetase TilS [Chloroflexota bacterium]